jgi:flagellar P-ring protein precursor FlgI
MKFRYVFLLLAMLHGAVALAGEPGVRLKEIARVQGVRDNALTGYGLVVGLAGSGDTSKNRLTIQSVANALSHFGVNISPDDLNSRNVAAVMVTTTLPPFAESGQKLDVSVSSVGDARSLAGGILLVTPLDGPDGKLYAVVTRLVRSAVPSRRTTPPSGVCRMVRRSSVRPRSGWATTVIRSMWCCISRISPLRSG